MLELIPEITACAIFLPLGYIFGYLMHFFILDDVTTNLMRLIKCWPYVVASVAAIVVGVLQFIIKKKYNQYKFEHFYIILCGMIFNVASGGLLYSKPYNDPTTAIYLMAVGHGMCYIPALSYMNIRVANSRYRVAKLSAAHLEYFFGVAVAATIIYSDVRYIASSNIGILYSRVNKNAGLAILIISLFVIALCCLNEILHMLKLYDYKSSLDKDVNRENNNSTIFLNKHFMVGDQSHSPTISRSHFVVESVSESKEFMFGLFAICTRFQSLYAFYFPFFYLTAIFSGYSNDYRYEIIIWFGVFGILISTLMLCCFNFKNQFMISSGLEASFLIIATVIIIITQDYKVSKIVMWVLCSFIGLKQSHSNICILNIANLKTNELFLAVGFMIEHITFGVLQYYTVNDRSLIFNSGSNFLLIFPHTFVCLLVVTIVATFAVLIIPKGSITSILLFKNLLLRKSSQNMTIAPNSNVARPQHYPQNFNPGQQSGFFQIQHQNPVQQPRQYSTPPHLPVQQPGQFQYPPGRYQYPNIRMSYPFHLNQPRPMGQPEMAYGRTPSMFPYMNQNR